jgi:hypothetical protein
MVTLYLFGNFLGWARILDYESDIERIQATKKERERLESISKYNYYGNFALNFNNARYSFSRDRLRGADLSDLIGGDMKLSIVPDLIIDSIGDQMIKKDESSEFPKTLTFLEFTNNYNGSEFFRYWFSYIENLISRAQPLTTNLEWQRLLMFDIFLVVFINFLRWRDKPPHYITGSTF